VKTLPTQLQVVQAGGSPREGIARECGFSRRPVWRSGARGAGFRSSISASSDLIRFGDLVGVRFGGRRRVGGEGSVVPYDRDF
jgi:hypothetical protein